MSINLNYSGFDGGKTENPENDFIRTLGFTGTTHYQFAHFANVDQDYLTILEQVRDEWARIDATYDFIYYPHISVGWDNSPRTGHSAVVKNNTPENFAKGLRMAREYIDAHPDRAPLITVNSWNEWTETSYLMPCNVFGYGYLEVVKRYSSTCNKPPARRRTTDYGLQRGKTTPAGHALPAHGPHLAENSYCVRRKVGALIVKDKMIISDGYNGTPSGFENICEDETGKTKSYVLHAEANAITKVAKSANNCDGSTLYITAAPCIECSKLIIQAGIRRVVYCDEYRSEEGLDLLRKVGIECVQIDDIGA